MREIKFRAWDKNGDGMFFNVQTGIQFEDGSQYTFDKFLNPHVLDTHQWEIMQFTGLKDKNGKEIYEGDLVHVDMCECTGYDNHGNEIFEDCDGEVSFSSVDGMFVFDGHSAGTIPVSAYIENITVIGNIYEHADLLKQSQ